MNRGIPADPLREAAEALHGYMTNLTGIPPEGFLWDDLRAALATKPAEMADEFERGRQQGMKQERALWNLTASSQEAADEECEPFKEPPAFTAWWSLANRPYHWTQTRLVALHAWNAALADTQRSSPTAGSDEAKDRGAPLGSEPVGEVYTMQACQQYAPEVCHVTLYRPLPRGTKLYASPPAGEKE